MSEINQLSRGMDDRLVRAIKAQWLEALSKSETMVEVKDKVLIYLETSPESSGRWWLVYITPHLNDTLKWMHAE